MSLEDYILNHIDKEPPQLAALNREVHVKLLNPRMVSGHLQGRTLKMLVRMCQPKRILEIGTFTGYATLCLAEGLPEQGEIHTIEIDDEMEDFIRKQFEQSEQKNKIRLHIGNALEIIPQLEGLFDMVFIDADKRDYCAYYEMVFNKVKEGGIIIADNTLWNGKVLDEPHFNDKQTAEIIRFNKMIAEDRRIEKVILPLRDGLTIMYKNYQLGIRN